MASTRYTIGVTPAQQRRVLKAAHESFDTMDKSFEAAMERASDRALERTAPTKEDRALAARTFEATIPAFSNAFPYNELLLDGKLIAKTRSWDWKHRGLTLLYTSTSTHSEVVRAHEMDPKLYPRKALVGVGNLVDVRPLTKREKRKLFSQFNNVPNRRAVSNRTLRKRGFWMSSDVHPLPIGFFFTDLKRFVEPVPFDWPVGPIRPIGVPISHVAAALKAVGVRNVNGLRI